MKRRRDSFASSSSTQRDDKRRKARKSSSNLLLDPEIEHLLSGMTDDELKARVEAIETEIQFMQTQLKTLVRERNELTYGVRKNDFVKDLFCQPPYLVGTINEKWDYDETTEETTTRGVIEEAPPGTQCSIVNVARKQSYFPHTGIVDPKILKAGQEVCLNPWSNVILGTLPQNIDLKVRALEVVDKPSERFSNIGGLKREIAEMLEATELPIFEKSKFKKLGIKPPKGVLLYGPPGTGKTMLARALAGESKSTFISLNGTILNQSFIGEGARIVRELFEFAKSKAPCIIFIDEIDAIGSTRSNRQRSTEREIQSTMMELLNQIDGFTKFDGVVVIAATNRVDALDPALLRSGRFDKKILIPNPTEQCRLEILKIHTSRMPLDNTIDLEEISKMTEGFSATMCRAVCAEAAMSSIRRDSNSVNQEDMYEGINEISNKRITDAQMSAYA